MSSGAAQLPRQRGGTCRHRGAVIGCRAPQTLQPERGLAAQPAAVVVVAVEDVRTPATPFVALSAVRTSAQLVERTSGVRASGVRASGVRASGVRASGVMQVSGQTGVRCPRPLRPRCPDRAGSRRSVPRDSPGLADRVRRVAVVPERLGRRCPNPAWLGRDGRGLAVRGWHEGRRQTWAAASHAHRLRRRARRLADQGAGPGPGCRSDGWEHAREQVLTSPPQVRLGQVAGVVLDHGAERKVVTTLRGCCAGVGLVSSGAGGPVGFSGA
jgi:hypothetical protein